MQRAVLSCWVGHSALTAKLARLVQHGQRQKVKPYLQMDQLNAAIDLHAILKENQMLQNLSVNQMEQAFQWLESPMKQAPPQELQRLNEVEWMLLERMLQGLLVEKEHSPVH